MIALVKMVIFFQNKTHLAISINDRNDKFANRGFSVCRNSDAKNNKLAWERASGLAWVILIHSGMPMREGYDGNWGIKW